jgi:hypothetical protein
MFAICFKKEYTGWPEYDLFLFSDWPMTIPAYLVNICLNFIFIAPMWVFVSQETERPKEIKQIAWIITGRGLDFILEANRTWFNIDFPEIGKTPIYYDTLMFAVVFFVVLKATFNE